MGAWGGEIRQDFFWLRAQSYLPSFTTHAANQRGELFYTGKKKIDETESESWGEKREIFGKCSFSLWIITFQLCPNSSLGFLALSLIVTSEVESSKRKNGSKGGIPKGVNTSPRVCWSYTRLGGRNLSGPQPIFFQFQNFGYPTHHIINMDLTGQITLQIKPTNYVHESSTTFPFYYIILWLFTP